MIAILDYGSGNLRSAQRAFEKFDKQTVVTSDPKICAEADGLVVPGVGAFAACMQQLVAVDGDSIIKARIEQGAPVFGICVGMQILFTSSSEKGEHKGLGIISGNVDQIKAPILPHIGWNELEVSSGSRFFDGLEKEYFYFVHSYAVKSGVKDGTNTFSFYGEKFLAAVEFENIFATQFHPEKSGAAGSALIKNWMKSL